MPTASTSIETFVFIRQNILGIDNARCNTGTSLNLTMQGQHFLTHSLTNSNFKEKGVYSLQRPNILTKCMNC